MKIGKILRVYMYLYKKKPDWNDKIYNWKFVEIETLRLKGGIILKKTSKDHNDFGFSGFVYHRRFSFLQARAVNSLLIG